MLISSAKKLCKLCIGFCDPHGLVDVLNFLVYTGASIATTFFATSAAFAGLSLFGYTTQRSVRHGEFPYYGCRWLNSGFLAQYLASISGLMWAVSFLGVLIFGSNSL